MENLEIITSGSIVLGSLICLGALGMVGYKMRKVQKACDRVVESTTRFLDAFMAYAVPRAYGPEDKAALIELAGTRRRYNI